MTSKLIGILSPPKWLLSVAEKAFKGRGDRPGGEERGFLDR